MSTTKDVEILAVLAAMREDDQLALLMEADDIVRFDQFHPEEEQAERLVAAGWRPGQTVEEARLLLQKV